MLDYWIKANSGTIAGYNRKSKRNIMNDYNQNNGFQLIFEDDLVVYKGRNVLIHGDNGTGKSTCLYTLGGLLNPIEKHINFNFQKLDIPKSTKSYSSRKQIYPGNIYFLLQRQFLFLDLTVECCVKHTVEFITNQNFDPGKYNNLCNLLRFDTLKNTEVVKKISPGNKQKLLLIIAILIQPNVIFLDEPFNNLDWQTIEIILNNNFFEDNLPQDSSLLLISHKNDIPVLALDGWDEYEIYPNGDNRNKLKVKIQE
ncbi:ATP-binding cassette domain-containing protein [bacterium]|nr:ATP-binding cassette domain-containing protein [bacterium]